MKFRHTSIGGAEPIWYPSYHTSLDSDICEEQKPFGIHPTSTAERFSPITVYQIIVIESDIYGYHSGIMIIIIRQNYQNLVCTHGY